MKEQEAIKIIKTEKQCVLRNTSGCNRDCGKCDLVMPDKDIICGYNMAIKALEKQIPKQPINDTAFGTCPNCHSEFNSELISEYDMKYCIYCGQALDLEHEKENQG